MDWQYVPLIVACALVTYGTRLAGLSLGERAIPDGVRRFLTYVPVAAFAALIVPGLGANGELPPRLAAAIVATIVVLRLGRLWACLAVGMTVYWLTRWAL
jgi:branched-subunit amino acid transport protein